MNTTETDDVDMEKVKTLTILIEKSCMLERFNDGESPCLIKLTDHLWWLLLDNRCYTIESFSETEQRQPRKFATITTSI